MIVLLFLDRTFRGLRFKRRQNVFVILIVVNKSGVYFQAFVEKNKFHTQRLGFCPFLPRFSPINSGKGF